MKSVLHLAGLIACCVMSVAYAYHAGEQAGQRGELAAQCQAGKQWNTYGELEYPEGVERFHLSGCRSN